MMCEVSATGLFDVLPLACILTSCLEQPPSSPAAIAGQSLCSNAFIYSTMKWKGMRSRWKGVPHQMEQWEEAGERGRRGGQHVSESNIESRTHKKVPGQSSAPVSNLLKNFFKSLAMSSSPSPVRPWFQLLPILSHKFPFPPKRSDKFQGPSFNFLAVNYLDQSAIRVL